MLLDHSHTAPSTCDSRSLFCGHPLIRASPTFSPLRGAKGCSDRFGKRTHARTSTRLSAQGIDEAVYFRADRGAELSLDLDDPSVEEFVEYGPDDSGVIF